MSSLRAGLATFVIAALAASCTVPAPLRAQESPARRLSSILGVAAEEYAKGVDSTGRLISAEEYQEARGFLQEAQRTAGQLSAPRGAQLRALLDTLSALMVARRPPAALDPVRARITASLGAEGALVLPVHALDPAAGRAIYQQRCASCHGERGLGDGPAAAGMRPAPPAIGSASAMAGASPAMLYRVVSVGVPGTQMPAWGAALPAEQRWNVIAYVQTLRATPAQVAQGEKLFLARCASCHGADGRADSAHSRTPSGPLADIGTVAWQVERSDSQIAAVIRRGVPGSRMAPVRDLSDAEVGEIVAYIRSLPIRRRDVAATPAAAPAARSDAGRAARAIAGALDSALAAARSGRTNDARDRAFDAYLAFEPLETTAKARSPGLVQSVERHFADFRGAIAANDLRTAGRLSEVIQAELPDVMALTRPTSGRWSAFLESFLIILREGFEAILVVGAVVAFLIKTGNRERLRAVWWGAALGVVASAITAVILRTALRAAPASSEVIEGVTLLIAVIVLFSVSYWLISKVEAAKWQRFIRDKVNAALARGGGTALAFVAFLAVYREGAETALFFQALFNDGHRLAIPLALGILIGGVALAGIFTLFYRFGVRIPLRPFFAVTGLLLYYMAFVFAGKGVRELQEGNAVSITLVHWLPRVSAMGIFPTVETTLAQLVLVALFVFAMVRTFWPRPTDTEVAAPVSQSGRMDV
ncbi:MAG TPA: FTR1 family protein [Gemmatimonadaceae bacterium]|nr:FTR1 family protein [Gemmatimonadaceae bacterium]